jgi:hypothetical protein
MNRSNIALLLSFVLLASLLSLAGFSEVSFAQTKEKSKTTMRQPSTYDRIQRAADMGELTLKEAVLLKAELLFAPSLIPKDSKYAPKPGEVIIQSDEGLTGFYKEVHRVFPELNEQEKKFLKSASPDLEAIITQREKEQKATEKENKK